MAAIPSSTGKMQMPPKRPERCDRKVRRYNYGKGWVDEPCDGPAFVRLAVGGSYTYSCYPHLSPTINNTVQLGATVRIKRIGGRELDAF